MRALVLAVLLVGCATRDVLRSEPIAERAVCSEMLVGIYGHPLGIPACASQVISLGDACYAVQKESSLSLVECAADAPDRHVMCLVDARASLPQHDPRPRLASRRLGPPRAAAAWLTPG